MVKPTPVISGAKIMERAALADAARRSDLMFAAAERLNSTNPLTAKDFAAAIFDLESNGVKMALQVANGFSLFPAKVMVAYHPDIPIPVFAFYSESEKTSDHPSQDIQ